MKLVIASDHAGFPLKEEVRAYLAKRGTRLWTWARSRVIRRTTIPTLPSAWARRSSAGEAPRGILICGSGVGVCVAANKIPGIRAGMCHDTYSAHQGVEHDDMNVLVLGARIIGASLAYELVDAFLRAKFISNEERFTRRFKKVLAIEAKYQKNGGQ
jgi:ribose 5-phosphate isomerase B